MKRTKRHKRIDELLAQLAKEGHHVVLAIDIDNVREILHNSRLKADIANEIASSAADDLGGNELGDLPIDEAIEHAAKDAFFMIKHLKGE